MLGPGARRMDSGGVELDRAVESIRVGHRFRRELGDLDELCASIEAVGLLQPITITPDGTLVCGARRLAAVKRLGWRRVKVWVTSTVSSQLQAVLAEQHENALRKPFTPTEAAALYAELKGLYAADAARRQQATRFGAVEPAQGTAGGAGSAPPASGKARQRAARAVTGKNSYWSLEHVREVQRLADDPAIPEHVRRLARRELAAMDADGTINGHYLRVRAAATAADLAHLAEDPGRPAAVRARAQAELRALDQAQPPAELVEAAGAALARAATGTASRAPTSGARLPRVKRYSVRALVATIEEMDHWWEHYDPAEIATGLTEEQWQRLDTNLAGSITFIGAVAALRSSDGDGAPDAAAHR